MKSIKEYQKKSIGQKINGLMVDKKGVLGLETVGSVIITLLVLAVIAIAVFLALDSLNTANLFTAGSQSANDTTNLINNITSGTTAFFANIPTVMVILGAVVIILAVVLIILAVGRISGGARAAEL